MLKQLDILIGMAVVFTIVSLLVTMATQFVTALLALRGKSFVRGLQVTFKQLLPVTTMTAELRELSERVASHSLITDSTLHKDSLLSWLGWTWSSQKFASAARPEEVKKILVELANLGRELAKLSEAAPAGDKENAARIVRKILNLEDVDPVDSARTEKAKGLASLAFQIVDAMPAPEGEEKSLAEASRALRDALVRREAAAGAEMETATAAAQVLTHLKKLQEKTLAFESAFDSAMDRAQQRFAYYGRQWSVALAFLIVLFLQFDTFETYRALASSEALRAQAVVASGMVVETAGTTLKEGAVTDASLRQATIDALDPKPKEEVAKALQNAQPNPEAMVGALRAFTPALDPKEIEQMEKQIHSQWFKLLGTRYAGAFKSAVDPLNDSSLAIQLKSWEAWWGWWNRDSRILGRLFGLLASILLVSLGAPFWFNSLKSLANLRPMISGKVEAERETVPKK